VQIGSIRSARGILGNWFDKDYDPAGPAGPTAFWKLSDDIVDDDDAPLGGAGATVGFGLGQGAQVDISDLLGAPEVGESSSDDDDDEGDGGEGRAGVAGAEGDAPPGHGGGPLTLADLARLQSVNVTIGGGGGGDGNGNGLVVPLQQLVQVLHQALHGGGGDGALRIEDLEGLLD
jgi:hypothetical protein